MLENNKVNIQDIFCFRSVSSDLHLHMSFTVNWVGAEGGEAGRNHYTKEHWCRIMQPCYDHSNTSESWESKQNDRGTTSKLDWCHFSHANQFVYKTKKKEKKIRGWIRHDAQKNKTTTRHRAAQTDLHSAFDQIEWNDSCVCGATAQNPTKATQDEILLRAELTTVSLWRNTGETLRTGHLWS